MLKLRSRGDMKNYKLDAKQLEKEISMNATGQGERDTGFSNNWSVGRNSGRHKIGLPQKPLSLFWIWTKISSLAENDHETTNLNHGHLCL